MNKKQRMYERIQRHGENLVEFFGIDIDPVKLCKKLRSLEIAANRVMCDYCNGAIDYNAVEGYILNTLKPKLTKIFGEAAVIQNVYINHDPRGYTLKLNELSSKHFKGHKDRGGYGILAPEFDGNI